MTRVHLLLPFPPSINGLYSTNWKTKRRFKSKAYEEWEAKAGRAAMVQGKRPEKPLAGQLLIDYGFIVNDKRRRDLMNYEKAVTDFLVSHGYIEDDSMIEQARLCFMRQDDEPKVIATVMLL